MVEQDHPKLSVRKQCKLLKINRSSVYRKHKVTHLDTELIIAIQSIYRKYPFYGHRRIQLQLKKEGIIAGKKKIRKTMKALNLTACYPKKNLSKADPKDKKYPYLLRNLSIEKVNQVWQTDITYLKINGSFVYLTAIIDVYSRKILKWSLSNTMQADFCVQALQDAITTYGVPDIVNTDQGVQYTCEEFIQVLKKNNVNISMVSKGRATDNIYIERLWRSLKYEEIYLNEYKDVKALKKAIKAYFHFYNEDRFHQALKYKTPNQYFFEYLEKMKVA